MTYTELEKQQIKEIREEVGIEDSTCPALSVFFVSTRKDNRLVVINLLSITAATANA